MQPTISAVRLVEAGKVRLTRIVLADNVPRSRAAAKYEQRQVRRDVVWQVHVRKLHGQVGGGGSGWRSALWRGDAAAAAGAPAAAGGANNLLRRARRGVSPRSRQSRVSPTSVPPSPGPQR